ncbi:Hydrolyzes glycerol-phospholipids at the terminal phosphodiesteric bond [Stylosanthes scabra]|uniref:Hydrolyzes glycerol-phospholipids at the terminal phosphodiesteric bond n=1 Tax=Stylosanthes scabra TaxID=79078 RepID=A0ABU6WTL8_9FABA|nr:Hydrolyzes glycerol-phospholipids at the terminal phosphodiesteric bond [Stylosanthes scabra]
MEKVLLHGDIDATVLEIQQVDDLKLKHLGVWLDDLKIEERRTRNCTNSPTVDESFHIRCARMTSNIIFELDLHGKAYVPAEDILDGVEVQKWVQIVGEGRYPIAGGDPKILV